MTRKEEIAWAAGLYEGEGNIAETVYSHDNRYTYKQMSIGQHKRSVEILKKFKRIVGVGKLYGPYRNKMVHWKAANPEQIVVVCLLLYPLLSKRRQFQIKKVFPRFRYYSSKHDKS